MSATDATAPPVPVPPQERRRYIRVGRRLPFTFSVLGRETRDEIHSATLNLGLGGLLLSAPSPVAPGTRLLLEAGAATIGPEWQIRGEAVWWAPDANRESSWIGVRFFALDAGQRERVLSVIGDKVRHPDGLEWRRFIRLKKRLPVEFRPRGRLLGRWESGCLTDLSVGGFAMEARNAPAAGTCVRLRLHLEEGSPPLELQADVIRNTAPMPGRSLESVASGRFRDVPTLTFERLAAYISRHVLHARPQWQF